MGSTCIQESSGKWSHTRTAASKASKHISLAEAVAWIFHDSLKARRAIGALTATAKPTTSWAPHAPNPCTGAEGRREWSTGWTSPQTCPSNPNPRIDLAEAWATSMLVVVPTGAPWAECLEYENKMICSHYDQNTIICFSSGALMIFDALVWSRYGFLQKIRYVLIYLGPH